MRHASIQTTMNVYGQAMPASKRSANSKVVRDGSRYSNRRHCLRKRRPKGRFSRVLFELGVFGGRFPPNPRNRLKRLVAGGFALQSRIDST